MLDDLINVIGACTKHPPDEIRRVFGNLLSTWLATGHQPDALTNAIIDMCCKLDSANVPIDIATLVIERKVTLKQIVEAKVLESHQQKTPALEEP